jgi:hypothetical protein
MARRVQYADLDVAQIQIVTVSDRKELVPSSATGVKHIPGASHLGQSATSGNVVGVYVRIHDVTDFHSGFLGSPQIELRLINWVAHGGQAFAPSPENIRSRYDRIAVKQLTQNHRALLCKALIEPCSIPVATGSPRARQS